MWTSCCPGEREDHRPGLQEPAVLTEAEGGERRSGWEIDIYIVIDNNKIYLMQNKSVFSHRKGACLPLQDCGGTAASQ